MHVPIPVSVSIVTNICSLLIIIILLVSTPSAINGDKTVLEH